MFLSYSISLKFQILSVIQPLSLIFVTSTNTMTVVCIEMDRVKSEFLPALGHLHPACLCTIGSDCTNQLSLNTSCQPLGFPGGSTSKESACNQETCVQSLSWGPLQYSGLENSMDCIVNHQLLVMPLSKHLLSFCQVFHSWSFLQFIYIERQADFPFRYT